MARYKWLVGDRCYLSPPVLEDAEQWTAWASDLDVAIPLGDEAYALASLQQNRDWIAAILRDQQQVYSIVTLADDRLIGRGMLFQVDRVNRSAMLGLVIGEKDCWDQGYGTEATRLLLDVGFSLLNLHSIGLGTFAFNSRAQRCYEKAGFKVAGRRRQARIIAGQPYDVVLMDILAEEFDSPYVRRHLPIDTAGTRGA